MSIIYLTGIVGVFMKGSPVGLLLAITYDENYAIEEVE